MYLNRCQTFKRLSTFTFGNFCKIPHSYAQLWFKQRRDLGDPTYLFLQDRKFSLSSSLSIPTNLAHCNAFSPAILCAKKTLHHATPVWAMLHKHGIVLGWGGIYLVAGRKTPGFRCIIKCFPLWFVSPSDALLAPHLGAQGEVPRNTWHMWEGCF